jgi:stearoyl-CoA desaturase (delta-9 desaturase)
MSSILKFINLYNESRNDNIIYINQNNNSQGFHKGWMIYYHSHLLEKLFIVCVMYNTFLLLTGQLNFLNAFLHFMKVILLSYFIAISNTIYHHRLVSHKSWECNRIVQIFLNIIGSIPTYIGGLKYASIHQIHHKVCDEDSDPYGGVKKGLTYNCRGFLTDKKNYFYKKPSGLNFELYLFDYFDFIPAFLFVPIYFYCSNSISDGIIIQFSSSVIISGFAMAGHFIGEKKKNNLKCEAMNDNVFGLLSTGECYHENHHSFPKRCNNAMSKGQFDLGFLFIKFLSKLNLAFYDIKRNDNKTILN